MKKLIAISVVFALVAGAAFAADISGDVFGTIELVNSDGYKDHDLGAGGSWGRTQISASGQNEEGTFGGWLRFRANGFFQPSYETGGTVGSWGNVWWKPIPQVQFLIGGNNDGLFGADGVTRWGFYQVAGDLGIASEGWAFSSAFFGGWGDDAGAVITVTPIDALAINIAVPFISRNKWKPQPERAAEVYKATTVQAAVNLDGIGKLAFTWGDYSEDGAPGNHLGTLFTYFNLTAVENLSVDLGIGLPFTQGGDKLSYFNMAIGLGVTFNISSFGVKARVLTEFGGTTYDGKTDPDAFKIVFDVMPYYAITDNVTVNLNFGMDATGANNDADGNEQKPAQDFASWHLYPYVTIKGGWWAPNFYAGIKVESKGGFKGDPLFQDDKPVVTFSVPIGIAFAF